MCKSPQAAVWIAVTLAIGMSFEACVASTVTGVTILRTVGAGVVTAGACADFSFNTTMTITTMTKTATPAAAPPMIPPSMVVTAHKDGRTVRNIDRHTQTAV